LPETVQVLLTPSVTANLPEAWQGCYSQSRAREWIRDRDAEGTTLLVTSRESCECIGLLFLHESESPLITESELRLGYLVAQSQWGNGYASEIVMGLVNWAREGPYASIIAGVSTGNPGSRRVLEKCGFSRIADDRSEEHFYGIRV